MYRTKRAGGYENITVSTSFHQAACLAGLLILTICSCRTGRSITAVGTTPVIGIIADCQYADQPTGGVRHYRLSPQKLADCVDTFNGLDLSHVFHLGDFIDLGGMESFDKVLPIMNRLKAPHTFVLGNHDFSVPDELKKEVPKILGLRDRYFSLKMGNWKFLAVDGNDISLYAWPENSTQDRAAEQTQKAHYPDHPTYNGAVGPAQLKWLERELEKSEKASEKVILLCHFPLLPRDNHILWNAQEVLDLISRYSCVKAWLNGHNHAGAYQEYQGIHLVTFQGMVDTETNAYATVQLHPDRIVIKGYGREPDRVLMF